MSTQELNEDQRRAVEAEDGSLLLLAGPGTGKTRTFAHRVAHLMTRRGVPAREILAVTFTRSAAEEMRERLKGLLPEGAGLSELWVETFHAAALRILRAEGYPFGPGAEFAVAGEEEKAACLKGLVPKRERPKLLARLRRMKEELKLPESGPEAEYQRRLWASRRLDFDDLILHACRLLDESPSARAAWRARFSHVLVDEFQDTSFAQYELLSRLAPRPFSAGAVPGELSEPGLAGGSVCVIGDPDQAIYGFSGGGFKPLERFLSERPGCRKLPLSGNYRSQAVILEAAKQVIGKNPAGLPRELHARLERGLPVEIAGHRSELQEAEMIARRIEGLLGGASHFSLDSGWAEKEGESYAYGLSDIAVLYRFHAQARRIEEALERAGLPFRRYGKAAEEEPDPGSELEDYRRAGDGAPPMAGPRAEAISLMTLHRAKGLEFPAVFLAGCEDGVLPYRELEEERRLFYVGMTRAKSRLFLSYSRRRTLFGRALAAGPSPFLLDIEEALRVLSESQAPAKKSPRDAQPTLFD